MSAAKDGGPVDRLELLGVIIDDERARLVHVKVARQILARFFAKYGNARASARFLQTATGLTAGSVVSAAADLVEWGYFTRTIGSGTRPTFYHPTFSVLQPPNATSVLSLPNARNSSVLQPPNASVLRPPNAIGSSVLQPPNETLLLSSATAAATVKEISAPGSAAGLSAAATRADIVEVTISAAELCVDESGKSLVLKFVDIGGEDMEECITLESRDQREQEAGMKEYAEMARAVGRDIENAEDLIGHKLLVRKGWGQIEYIPADAWGRRALGLAA